jgi:hypothetical protein
MGYNVPSESESCVNNRYNLLTASSAILKAKSTTAFGGACWATTPANGTNTIGVVLALVVAKSSVVFLIAGAAKNLTSSATVRVLVTRNADIGHAVLAIRGTDAAAKVVEAFVTNGVPKETPLFAVVTLGCWANTTTVGVRLSTVSSVITEVGRAVLPADGTDTIVSISALRVAKPSILIRVIIAPLIAAGDRDTHATTVSKFPAGGVSGVDIEGRVGRGVEELSGLSNSSGSSKYFKHNWNYNT